MNKMVQLNLNPDIATLRNFGFIAFFGFGGIALMAWYERFIFGFGLGEIRSVVTLVFTVLSIVCLTISCTAPKLNKYIFIGMSVITFPIGVILSYTIMGFLFYILFGGIAVIMRLVGYDPMKRRYDSNAESYWSKARPERDASDYFRQY